MKKIISIILLTVFSLGAMADPGDIIQAPNKTSAEIFETIGSKMKTEFDASTQRSSGYKQAFSIFEFPSDDYTVTFTVEFIIYDGEYSYSIEYSINSNIDNYNYAASDKQYVLLNQDLAYIQGFIEHLF